MTKCNFNYNCWMKVFVIIVLSHQTSIATYEKSNLLLRIVNVNKFYLQFLHPPGRIIYVMNNKDTVSPERNASLSSNLDFASKILTC